MPVLPQRAGVSRQAAALPGRALGKAVVSRPLRTFPEWPGPPSPCTLGRGGSPAPAGLPTRPIAWFLSRALERGGLAGTWLGRRLPLPLPPALPDDCSRNRINRIKCCIYKNSRS